MGASLAHSGSSGAGALADIRGFYIPRMYGLGLLFNFTHAFSIPSERGIMCIFCSNNSHALNLLPKAFPCWPQMLPKSLPSCLSYNFCAPLYRVIQATKVLSMCPEGQREHSFIFFIPNLLNHGPYPAGRGQKAFHLRNF